MKLEEAIALLNNRYGYIEIENDSDYTDNEIIGLAELRTESGE